MSINKEAVERMNDNNVMIYQDENGITKVSVRFSDEDIWVTQQQLAEVYDTTQQNISQHIDGIYKEGELPNSLLVSKG